MKLKKFISACVALATVATCSSVAFAADNTMTMGTPIDLSTGAEIGDTLTAGDVIAIPVDISSSTGSLTSTLVRLALSDNLQPGVTDTDLTDDQYTNLEALGGEIATEDSGVDYYVKNIFKAGRRKSFPGTWMVNPTEHRADGTTTYEFPVRVNSATGATDAIDVDIYATTTADEAGATTSTDKKIGSINLTMDGTVTSYNTVNGTIAK